MALSDPIDSYCERLDPSFWAEPFNAVSNVAFLVAAAAAFRLSRRAGVSGLAIGWLLGLLVAIGLGSFAFHTLATGVAMLADVIPIALFQLSFLVLHARLALAVGPVGCGLLVAGFFALAFAFGQLPAAWLNGSLGYAPALLLLLFLAWLHGRRQRAGARLLPAAAALFGVSLTFRSLDLVLCETLPTGTHMLWHTLNGGVLYLCIAAHVRARGAGGK